MRWYWLVTRDVGNGRHVQDDMNCAEDYVRFMCQWLLDHCLDDMKFLSKLYDNTAIDRLKMVASTPFVRITYTEAVQLLEKVRSCDEVRLAVVYLSCG